MFHCLYQRKHHETPTDEQEIFEAEFQARDSRSQEKRQSYSDKRRRSALKHINTWKRHIAKHQAYRNKIILPQEC